MWASGSTEGEIEAQCRQGLRNLGGEDGLPTNPSSGGGKLNGRAAPEAAWMETRGFHGNAPRTGADVTVGLAPRPAPSEH